MGGFFAFQPLQQLFALYDFGPGVARYLGSLPLLALEPLSITSLGFTLSCFNMKPAAATICTLSYFFVGSDLPRHSVFRVAQAVVHHQPHGDLVQCFRSPIPVATMVEDYAYLLGVNLTLVIIGMLEFPGARF